ncbi:MAG: ABC transporter substrate-binding protein [Rhodobiaceae bacterium]|nr:ABC transporter substrate-binding protein [Rhodobiaceae bacterium]MCC0057526.1 ABC transporter substrate-binding protein [Rhodobiaceae bacterium]
MHGAPALGEAYTHFPDVNPAAPKGGTLTLSVLGGFDSLNPLIVRGTPAKGVRDHVYESLMIRGADEPFTLYGLIAESVDLPADRRSITFHLRPEAHFSDGAPVRPADVIFSWQLLKDHGRPNTRTYYAKVVRAVEVAPNAVRFEFNDEGDREIPLIMGLMPILPEHLTDPDTFEQTTLTPIVGSGPYRIGELRPGNRITFERDPNYWGRDMPFNVGRNNFDRITYEYFRDETALFEAFNKGLVDLVVDEDPTRWAQGYGNESAGDIVRETLPLGTPRPLSALVFNTRRPPFDDIRVRAALTELFDAEWINKTLYAGLFGRTEGYFDGSELSSIGRKAEASERELLGDRLASLPPAIVEGTFHQPATDGTGRNRQGQREATALLSEAGYRISDGIMRNASGEALAFEILVATREQERLALTYARMLRRAGIELSVRSVDATQFEQRRQTYDFDMLPFVWTQSLSPGNEQAFYWSSEAANADGTRNYPGIRDPDIDRLIDEIVAARDRVRFVASVRALDRLLVAGLYVIPLYHIPGQWIARWTRIERPEMIPLNGLTIDRLWYGKATR